MSTFYGGTAVANVSIQESSAIQKALDSFTSPGIASFGYPPINPSLTMPGGTVKLGRGIYRGDLTLSNRGTTLEGESAEGTIIDGSVFVNAGRCRVKNLTIVRPLTSAYCLKLSWTSAANKVDRCVVSDVMTYGGDIGLLIDAAILITVRDSFFTFAQTAAGRAQRTVPPYGSPPVQPTNTTLKFIGCSFQNCQGKGLYLTQSSNTLVQGCSFESNVGRDIEMNGVEGATVQGNNIEAYIDKDAMVNFVNMTAPTMILGNWFNSGYGGTAGSDIYGNPAFGTHGPTRALLIQQCGAGGVIYGNRFLKQKGANGDGTGITWDVADTRCARWRSRSNNPLDSTSNNNGNSPSLLTYRNLQSATGIITDPSVGDAPVAPEVN